MNNLQPTANPNLPVAPTSYGQRHFDILNNVLRLYFNRIDGITQALLGSNGLRFIQSPHIAASDATDQYAGGDNTATLVTWSSMDSGSGFTLNVGNTATAQYDGIYKIDYSLQFVNTDNAQHDVEVWLKVDGDFITNSASKFTIPARKSAGVYGYLVAYSSVTFAATAGDEIGLWWATTKAYNTTGPVDGVYMEYLAAQTAPPYDRPAVPSAIGSIVFVSNTSA